jgi:hypothetical protein
MSNPYSVQRSAPRYSILAIAELSDQSSTMCIVGKTSQISRRGCYVATPSTLPLDTLLNVVISHEGVTFMTSGKVIYIHEGIGMGIVFVDAGQEQLKILDGWLAGAAQSESP